jgi:transposase
MGDADRDVIARLEARINALEDLVAQQAALIAQQAKRISDLEAELARYKRNSSNSSKPPSSDITKPPKPPPPAGRGKRARGGQPRHKRHEREAFPPEQVDEVITHTLDRCPKTGRRLKKAGKPPRVLQQVGLVAKPFVVREHRCEAYWCAACGEIHYATLPQDVRAGGLFDADFTALIGYLKGTHHMSYTGVQRFLKDVMGLDVSRGHLTDTVHTVGEALAEPYTELEHALPDEPGVNVDETGHHDNGKLWWTWVFRTARYALFKIVNSRGSKVLVKMLGADFDGVLGCDYFASYRKYMKDFDVFVQFCLAHLIREVKFLAEHPDKPTAAWGARLREALRGLFGVIHRRDQMTPRGFRRALKKARRTVLKCGTTRVPERNEAQKLAKRLRKHGAAYFTFITTPEIDPTNNVAERAIRFIVIDRRITQGTRGARGRAWCERIWTAIATCAQQGRSAFRFLVEAVHAHLMGAQAPSLLPSGP